MNPSVLHNIFFHLPLWDMPAVAAVCREWRKVAEDINFIRLYCLEAGISLKGIEAKMIFARAWKRLNTQSYLSFSHSYQGPVAVWSGRFAGRFLHTITVKSYLSDGVIHLPFSRGHSLVDIQYEKGTLVVASHCEKVGKVAIYRGEDFKEVKTHEDLPKLNAIKLQGERLVWGTQRGATLMRKDAPQDCAWDYPVTAITCDPDHVFFGDLKGRVMKWGDDVRELPCHRSKITALDVSCTTLVSGSFDRTVCVIDTATFTVRHRLYEHTHAVMSVRIYQNLCVSGSLDETVRVWDLAAHDQTFNARKRSRVPRVALIQILRTGKPVCKVDFSGSLLVASSGYTYPTIYDFTPWETSPAPPRQLLPRPQGHPDVLFSTE